MMTTLLLSSCGTVFDDGEVCTPQYDIYFVSDRNMSFNDDFKNTVKSISLYVFYQDGSLAGTFTETDPEVLSTVGTDGHHHMRLPLQPGQYEMVAWCGLDHGETPSFTLDHRNNIQTKADLTCRLTTSHPEDDSAISASRLTQLHNGYLSHQVLPSTRDTSICMPLTRDVKTVNILLERMDHQVLDPADFDFRLEGDNTWLDYDNSLLEAEPVCYVPYMPLASDNDGRTVKGELSTSRLMPSHPLTLTVRKISTNSTVLKIPFISYALLTKPFENSEMDSQEYLDRRDDYSIIFFLNDNDQWNPGQIIVNGWRIVDFNSQL